MAKRITTLNETLRPISFGRGRDALVGYYEVELRGLLQHMPADSVLANFGAFECTDRSTVLYSATVWADHGVIFHDYHSEFLDDLADLQAGRVRAMN